MNLMDLFIKIRVDDQASGNIEKITGKIGSGLATAAKVGAAAVGAAAAGIVALTKASVDQYAEYEQLVGGAQLMFGDAYDTVAKNAQEAYSTVQMSQIEYLRQVNGFATGLKTALGGNERAAAELADRIITAEADVVAATGNTLENVQNAFNGIMKSNFTMLDNLQIGITPTKEGFQEVIDKVNEWNATNGRATQYQMGNLADMQSALVDYIDMVGMSGYAQQEASKTIQGSLAAMRAAWQNLVTGLADENANIDELLNAFLSSVGNVATNIVPVIKRIVKSIVNTLIENGPELLAQGTLMLAEFVLGLINGIPDMVVRIPEIIEAIVTAFSERGDEFKDVGLQIVQGIWEGIKGAGGWLLDKIGAFFSGIVDSAKETLGIHSPSRVFADIGKNMALGVGEGWNDEFKGVKGNINGSVVQGWKKTEGKTYGLNASQNPVNIVIETVLDGAVLARKTYKHNQTESMLRGNSLVEGVV